MSTQDSQEFKEGHAAWTNGESIDTNPYEVTTDAYCRWVDGWRAAYDEAMK